MAGSTSMESSGCSSSLSLIACAGCCAHCCLRQRDKPIACPLKRYAQCDAPAENYRATNCSCASPDSLNNRTRTAAESGAGQGVRVKFALAGSLVACSVYPQADRPRSGQGVDPREARPEVERPPRSGRKLCSILPGSLMTSRIGHVALGKWQTITSAGALPSGS
jgi:hypothetical protein